ncbi:MAG: hypothetical protein IT183_13280, partial [Acidobacteria bacterium]|nr:hypothetical protein [Acidobacteriota bacterium]
MHLVHVVAVAGVIAAVTAVFTAVTAAAALAAALVLLSLSLPLPAGRGRQGLVVLAVAALTAAHAASTRDASLAPPLGRWFAAEGGGAAGVRGAPEPVRVRGVLTEDAARTATGAVRLRLHVQEVDPGAGWRPAP